MHTSNHGIIGNVVGKTIDMNNIVIYVSGKT